MPDITSSLKLPCGAELSNRLAKAAMTEGLADSHNRATGRHIALYRRWAQGGAGLLLTGNVQVDRRYMERPGNVAIDGEQDNAARAALSDFAAAAKEKGAHIWMQISHAGRQTPISLSENPPAPSAVPLALPGKMFGAPRAMGESEIEETIARFAHAAKLARETGFTGVQIHGAHGYLVSEFLSPRVNQRTDKWGGSLENRSRLLVEIIRAQRRATAPDFPIAVKLNSADFQQGGFSEEDSLATAQMLEREGVDLLEISGGNYELPAMMGAAQRRASTIVREAYFLEYAAAIRQSVQMPLMVTGGFRTAAAMNAALAEGALDVIGLARPMCSDPDLPGKLLRGERQAGDMYEATLRLGPTRFLGPRSPVALIRGINGWGQQGWFCLQLIRMGDGLEPDKNMGVFSAFRNYARNEARTVAALSERPSAP